LIVAGCVIGDPSSQTANLRDPVTLPLVCESVRVHPALAAPSSGVPAKRDADDEP
jgi:hypothetical protein